MGPNIWYIGKQDGLRDFSCGEMQLLWRKCIKICFEVKNKSEFIQEKKSMI
jgi:hypothetical protein